MQGMMFTVLWVRVHLKVSAPPPPPSVLPLLLPMLPLLLLLLQIVAAATAVRQAATGGPQPGHELTGLEAHKGAKP